MSTNKRKLISSESSSEDKRPSSDEVATKDPQFPRHKTASPDEVVPPQARNLKKAGKKGRTIRSEVAPPAVIEGLGQGFPVGVCVSVAHIRPRSYKNLEEWHQTEGNVLAVRNGRVFLEDKRVFTYPSSPWANPFKLKEYSLDEALLRFDAHLDAQLEDPTTRKAFLELRRAREIGCFCVPGARCHRDIILKKLRGLVDAEAPSTSSVVAHATQEDQ